MPDNTLACAIYPDGNIVRIVLLDNGRDLKRVVEYYERLDANTLYMRFMAPLKNVRDIIVSMASRGCRFLAAVDEKGVFLGVGELCPVRDGVSCEGALSVVPSRRKRGVGSLILMAMLCLCQSLGRGKLVGEVLVFNDVALRFFRRVGGVLTGVDDGIVRGFIPVEAGRALAEDVLAVRSVRARCGGC